MNKEKIYQLLKDNIITFDQAGEYLNINKEDTEDVSWHEPKDGVWTYDYDRDYDRYLQEDEDDGGFDVSELEQLRHAGHVLRKELNWLTNMWAGLYKTEFKALTPDILSQLYERCQNIQSVHIPSRDKALEDAKKRGCEPLEVLEFESVGNNGEMELLDCIVKSWLLSNGQEVKVCEYKLHALCTLDPNMLQVRHVAPWDMPAAPKLSIPERPAAILEVMSVDEDGARAGWIDVFNPIIMVERLTVDEPLCVGDKIIIKCSGWSPKTFLLKDPEYDGLAEPECPLSTEEELLAIKYTFNPDKEHAKLLDKHKKDWLRQHWKVLTEAQILRLASGENIDDDKFTITDIEDTMRMWKYMKTATNMEYETLYEYENNRYVINKYEPRLLSATDKPYNIKVT